jgi:sugar O-acyltransferase (sialic acid O-acetyltransferase NeuD family)
MLKQIAVFGAGGFGLEVAMLIEQINANEPQWNMIGFFDDADDLPSEVNGYPILGDLQALNSWESSLSLALGLGTPLVRKTVRERLTSQNIDFPTLMHPSVIMGNTDLMVVGEGCIFCAGTIITTNIEIGNQVVLNLACTVGHETKLGDYSTFMPNCNISGEVEVGEENFWGTGAKIINRTKVGKRVIVGAGSIVLKDLPDGVTAVGVPAKIISKPS